MSPWLMNGAIGRDEQVRPQQILVQLQRSLQICRACLFLALEDHFQVYAERNFLRVERVNGRKKGNNRSLIVRCRPRINPPVIRVCYGPFIDSFARLMVLIADVLTIRPNLWLEWFGAF